MSVAIEVKVPNGSWVQLVDGVEESGELVEEWVDLARELYPASEVRIVEAAEQPGATRH